MVKKLISLFILMLFLVSVMAITVDAKSRVKDVRLEKLSHYGFMFDKKARILDAGVESRGDLQTGKHTTMPISLGVNANNSPGEIVGYTYQAYQSNSTQGRQVDWRAPNPQIHFSWTLLMTEQYDVGPRAAAYNVYDPLSGT